MTYRQSQEMQAINPDKAEMLMDQAILEGLITVGGYAAARVSRGVAMRMATTAGARLAASRFAGTLVVK